ncbi:cupin domain-containing protein [Euzebya tangerina]|uniref:cupin domain-containing protein n=1 Tax=Euzebya tangerina TaxID=591198 RepID=UPI000E322085|nr:cupin domain-containing protein [Euzebya tangerina]
MAAPDVPVSLSAKYALIDDHWSPKIVAEFNGNHVKLVKVEGTFEWHTHDDTDEVFMCLGGELVIEVDGREPAHLAAGDLYVVPRGVRHRPIASEEALIAIVEPADTPNTGDEATAAEESWI